MIKKITFSVKIFHKLIPCLEKGLQRTSPRGLNWVLKHCRYLSVHVEWSGGESGIGYMLVFTMIHNISSPKIKRELSRHFKRINKN